MQYQFSLFLKSGVNSKRKDINMTFYSSTVHAWWLTNLQLIALFNSLVARRWQGYKCYEGFQENLKKERKSFISFFYSCRRFCWIVLCSLIEYLQFVNQFRLTYISYPMIDIFQYNEWKYSFSRNEQYFNWTFTNLNRWSIFYFRSGAASTKTIADSRVQNFSTRRC
jgi:hypothetical protein